MTKARIFISYRREDSEGWAGRIYDRLKEKSGEVFMDAPSMPVAVDYRQYLMDKIKKSDVFIAVIGPTWLTISNENGRRLDYPKDILRQEVATALEEDMLVIPVLVGDAVMPEERDLPLDIRKLSGLNAAQLSSKHFDQGVEELFETVNAYIQNKKKNAVHTDASGYAGLNGVEDTSGKPRVYLALTSADRLRAYTSLKKDLKDRGYLIVPGDISTLYIDEVFKTVREVLAECVLSIHIIGESYIPEVLGDRQARSLVSLQNAVAATIPEEKLPRIIWIQRGLTPDDERQVAFIDTLRTEPALQQGADLYETSFEVFKTNVFNKLKMINRTL